METNVDLIGHGTSQGEVAGVFQANQLNPSKMRPFFAQDKEGNWGSYISVFKGGDPKKPENFGTVKVNTEAVLRREEWQALDQAILGIAEQRLTGFNDLVSRGLVYNLGNAMGTTVLESHTVSDAMEADLTMDGVTRSKGDRPIYGTTYLPIPIIHVDYEINSRVLAASRSLGNALDTTSAERAARRVAEKCEDMLFTSTTYSFGGGTIYSLVNYPDRELVNLSDYGDWATTATTGAKIVESVLAMKQASINKYFYGPWVLYIPTNFETRLDNDYDTTTPGTTIRERIMKIAGIQAIKVIDRLASGNVLLVQTTTDVVRIVRGMGLTNVQWSTEGNFVNKYKVLTIQVPQIRSDFNGHTGIIHMAVGLV